VIKYVIESKSVVIAGEFSTSEKFSEISWKYQNSAAKGKFRGLARNSMASGKLWVLVITRSLVQALPHNNSGQVVYTRVADIPSIPHFMGNSHILKLSFAHPPRH